MKNKPAFIPQQLIYAGAAAALLLINDLLLTLYLAESARFLYTSIITPLLSLAATVAVFYAAWRMQRSGSRLAYFWTLAAVAQACYAVGEVLWVYYDQIALTQPFPSPADIFYLAYSPIFVLAVLTLPAMKVTLTEKLKLGVDLQLILLAAGSGFWYFLIGPLVSQYRGEPLINQALGVAYPVADLVQIWALTLLVFRLPAHTNRNPLLLLVAAASINVVADCFFTYQSLTGTYEIGQLLDVAYNGGYLVYALAGLWQGLIASQEKPAQPDREVLQARPQDNATWLYYLPYGWVLGVFILLLHQVFQPSLSTPFILVIFTGLTFFLVIIRQVLVLKENTMLVQELRLANAEVQRQQRELQKRNSELLVEITERQRAEEKLSYEALHDSLTLLPNRALFLSRLAAAARIKQNRPDYRFSVLFLDLDGFKVINDNMGHSAGDRLLVKIGCILQDCVRSTDTVARLGGDEFVFLLEDLRDLDMVRQISERILHEISRPIEMDGTMVYLSGSLGVVLEADTALSPEEILRDADLAMYQAKAFGKARYELFSPNMRTQAARRMESEDALRLALEQEEFSLQYQPIISLKDQRLTAFEVSLRWDAPTNGLAQMAEETGLSLPLGRAVIRQVCRQLAAWQPLFAPGACPCMHINLSPRQVLEGNLFSEVSAALEESGIPGSLLAVEITEEIWVDHTAQVNHLAERLSQLGVSAWIDNFGAGKSALRKMEKLTIGGVIVDPGMVAGIRANQKGPLVAHAVLGLLQELGLEIIITGVEQEDQLAVLQDYPAVYAQGSRLSPPLDAHGIEAWLRETA